MLKSLVRIRVFDIKRLAGYSRMAPQTFTQGQCDFEFLDTLSDKRAQQLLFAIDNKESAAVYWYFVLYDSKNDLGQFG